jgi:hypothetical protein
MRFSPQVGFSAAKRRIKFLTSIVTRGLPTGLDFQRQKRRNALRCQPIKLAGLTIINELRQSNQRASLENTNLSPGVVGIAFFSRSRNRANCLRKNRFSATRAVRLRQTPANKLKLSLTIVRKFRKQLESRVKSLNIPQSSHANSLISRADRIFAQDNGPGCGLRMRIFIAYTYNVMPNKTIYVKDTDLPLLEQAQAQLGDSVSSMFAEFLRERVARLTPEENRIVELINQITAAREAAKRKRDLPEFIEAEHAEAQAYAERALKGFRAGEIRKTKALFWAANTYYERAQRDAKEVSELNEKISEMLGPSDKHISRPRK